MKRIVWSILLVFFVFTLSVSAAGNGEEGDGDKVKLTVIHNMLEETEGGAAVAFKEALGRVRGAYPHLAIVDEGLAASAYNTKIKTLAAGNELPDLFIIRGSMLNTLIDNELVQSVEADIKANREWESGFLPGSFDVFTRGEKIYGIPLSAKSTSLVFYNKEIFEEAGVGAFPSTLEEFKTAVRKIKAAGYTPIALGNKDRWVVNSCIMSTLGDRFTGTEWFWKIKAGSGARFTDPEFVASLQMLKDLADMGAFNSDMNSIDNMQMKTLYYQNKAAMFIEGAWAIGNISSDAPEDVMNATGIALLPASRTGKGNPASFSGGASVAYVINGELSGENREVAVRLLEELSGRKYGATMAESNKFPAVVPGEYNESKLSPLTREYNKIVDNTVFTPVYDIHLTPPVIEVMDIAAQELLIGLISPEEMAEKIQKEYELADN